MCETIVKNKTKNQLLPHHQCTTWCKGWIFPIITAF